MKRIFYKQIHLLYLAILILFIFNASLSFGGQYKVTRVIDGHAFVVSHGSIKITVILVGVDAPVLSSTNRRDGQPFSLKSTQHLTALVLSKVVDVKSYGTDRNGRTLGEVFLLNGKNVNVEMVQAGLAEVCRENSAPSLDMVPYWNAENDAKAARRGIWTLGEKYTSPREWRKTHQK